MLDPRLEFLSNRSKSILEKQIEFFRQKQSSAGIIIGVASLFIPFFINSLADSLLVLQILSAIPILMFVTSIILLLLVLTSRGMGQGFDIENIDEMFDEEDDNNVLIREIKANKDSFEFNKKHTNKVNRLYDMGIIFTIAAVLCAIVLLVVGRFINEKKVESTTISITTHFDDNKEIYVCFTNNQRLPPLVLKVNDSDLILEINKQHHEQRDEKHSHKCDKEEYETSESKYR